MYELYGSPEKFGLETVGEVDWSSGSYEFDLTVVWRRKSDGAFFFAEDSGCSCPSPFESVGVDDLMPVESLSEFHAHLTKRTGGNYYDRSEDTARLVERLHGMGLR
ncbi:hypothetical protein [Micromonospora sp. WMMD1082]|uniref:DUF7574 domain-containing protein n=1 Tax=Micromonospora sp. WMMD1082 TaxID=3016104 RepID=UPI002416B37C|nr:hypothetical protein [Micromonospora sp. WMMD1082]MDG4792720.1 hypothetical protein [Micromonospora sp. WMMD1082]